MCLVFLAFGTLLLAWMKSTGTGVKGIMFLQRKENFLLLELFRYERQEKVQHIPQRNSILNNLWEIHNTENFQELIKMQICRFRIQNQSNHNNHNKIWPYINKLYKTKTKDSWKFCSKQLKKIDWAVLKAIIDAKCWEKLSVNKNERE